MIDCPNGDIRDLLPDLLHDRLPPAQRIEVEGHVASCDACRAEFALLRDLRGTMARVPKVDTTAIAAAIPPYRATARRSWVGWRAAAAITMIAAGGTSVAILNHQGAATVDHTQVVSSPSVPTSRPAEVTSPALSVPVGSGATAEPSAPASPTQHGSSAATPAPEPSAEPSIAMASGAVNELSDRQLSELIDEIESLDVLPSADVESASTLLPPISTDVGHE